MTTLEIFLIILLWISYGIFSAFQEKEVRPKDVIVGKYCTHIMFAGIVLVIKATYGIFKEYK